MAKSVVEYRCLLVSPGDVEAERGAVSELVGQWNAQVGPVLGCRVELVRWETHAVPDASDEPQKVLNRQIVDDCDFGMAVFWARLGSATSSHKSGSVEEIDRLLERGARVLIYFNVAPIPQERLQDQQFSQLQEFKKRMQSRGLLGSYNGIPDLRTQIQLHLTTVVGGLLERDRAQPAPTEGASAKLTAPLPDVRGHIHAVVIVPSSRNESYLRVVVQNHSPIPVFIAGISVILKSGKGLYPPRDALTHESQSRRRLESGESLSYFLDGVELLKSAALDELDHVIASDDVGRVYRSSTEELRQAAEQSTKEEA